MGLRAMSCTSRVFVAGNVLFSSIYRLNLILQILYAMGVFFTIKGFLVSTGRWAKKAQIFSNHIRIRRVKVHMLE